MRAKIKLQMRYALVTVWLKGEAYDRDGEIVRSQWEQLSGTRIGITAASMLRTTFVAPTAIGQSEELVFQLTVTDDDDATASDTVSVTINPVHSITPSEDTIAWESALGVGTLSRTIALTNTNPAYPLDVTVTTDQDWLTSSVNELSIDAGDTGYLAVHSNCEEVGKYDGQFRLTDVADTTTINVSSSCDTNFDNDAFSEHVNLVMDDLLEEPGYNKALVGDVAHTGLGIRATAPVFD